MQTEPRIGHAIVTLPAGPATLPARSTTSAGPDGVALGTTTSTCVGDTNVTSWRRLPSTNTSTSDAACAVWKLTPTFFGTGFGAPVSAGTTVRPIES